MNLMEDPSYLCGWLVGFAAALRDDDPDAVAATIVRERAFYLQHVAATARLLAKGNPRAEAYVAALHLSEEELRADAMEARALREEPPPA